MKKLKDYYKGNEATEVHYILTALCRAYADQPETLLVTVEELRYLALAFEVETDWDGKIWGMRLMVEK